MFTFLEHDDIKAELLAEVARGLDRRGLKAQVTSLLKDADEEQLQAAKNALTKGLVEKELEALEQYSWYEGGAKTLVRNGIMTSKVDTTSKISFIKSLQDDKLKFPSKVFERPIFQHLVSLVPRKVRSNPMYKELAPTIFKFSEQSASGVGKGELFLLMFGLNSQKPTSRGAGAKGDVIIDGWSIEVKDSGGNIHAGKEEGLAKASEVYTFNYELLKDAVKDGFPDSWKQDGKTIKANPAQFRLVPSTKKDPRTMGGDWFWRYLSNDIPDAKWQLKTPEARKMLIDYLQRVYYTMDRKDATFLGTKMFPAIGDRTKMQLVMDKYLAAWVFDSYKKVEKFDSLMILNMKSGFFGNVVDGDRRPKQVKFGIPQIAKGKSTYAVPSGAIKIELK